MDLPKTRMQEQSKYAYYLLSAAAACIALTLKRTQDLNLEWNMTLLGLAVICWTGSFICGCVNRIKLINFLEGAIHKENARKVGVSIPSAFDEVMEEHNYKAGICFSYQWRFLIAGAVFYIAWHILQMF